MPDKREGIYWDADVFLSYVDGDEDRLPTIDELIRRARAHEIELVTSLEKYAAVAGLPIRPPITPQAQLPGTQGS